MSLTQISYIIFCLSSFLIFINYWRQSRAYKNSMPIILMFICPLLVVLDIVSLSAPIKVRIPTKHATSFKYQDRGNKHLLVSWDQACTVITDQNDIKLFLINDPTIKLYYTDTAGVDQTKNTPQLSVEK